MTSSTEYAAKIASSLPNDLRVLYPSGPQVPPAELLWRDQAPAAVTDIHDVNNLQPEIKIYELTNVNYGGMGLFFQGKDIVVHKGYTENQIYTFLRKFLRREHWKVREWSGGLNSGDRKVISSATPVLTPLHPNWIFGHFLLEMLPLALLLDRVCPKEWPIAMARTAPDWLSAVIKSACRDRPIIQYALESEVISAPSFVNCTQMITHQDSHLALRELIADLKGQLLREPVDLPFLADPEKIFLSRGYERKGNRLIENATEIEATMSGLGFSIVRPETLSFATQVHIFDKARIIVGEYSSAMHNAIFARPGTSVVCLNCINSYQSQIAKVFDHRIGYITTPDGQIHTWQKVLQKGGLNMQFDTDEIVARLLPLL